MNQRVGGFRVVVAAVVAFGFSATGVQGQWRYYYFDKPQRLTLDTTKVAVFEREEGAVVTVTAALSRHGIAAKDVRPSQIPRMSIARTQASRRNEADVKALVKSLADAQEVEFASPVFVDSYGPLIITRHLHVGFVAHVDPQQAKAILAEMDAGVVKEPDWARMKGVYRLQSRFRNGFEVLEVANKLAQHPDVKFAEPDMIMTGTTTALIPNDPGFPNCWGLHNTGQSGGTPDMDMDGPEAWDISIGEPSIIVAIMDLGIEQDHPDINQIPGMDFTGNNTGGGPASECDDHGTQVAGCVSASINNGLGTVGIAPGCMVASAKWGVAPVTDPCGPSFNAQISWLVDALDWAQTIGAGITNHSWGSSPVSTWTTKFAATREAGILHFAAAGNGRGDPNLPECPGGQLETCQIGYPASLPTVNAVAALERSGTLAHFSQFGEGLAFSSPGYEIYTTDLTGPPGVSQGDYGFVWGTSFATPYSCGVGALILSTNPGLSPEEVEQIMQDSSVDLGDAGYDTTFGWGFVNAYQALDCNGNGVADVVDIADDTSEDCNVNLIPDECEPDFDGDGLIYECDYDADGDGVHDQVDRCLFTPLGIPVDAHGGPISDTDENCVVDMGDILFLTLCLDMSGPAVPSASHHCTDWFDYPETPKEDPDNDVDLHDCAGFQNAFGRQ